MTLPVDRLESRELLLFEQCPFALPTGSDLELLLAQHTSARSHRNIHFDPRTGQIRGLRSTAMAEEERLIGILENFSRTASTWLAEQLPEYASAWSSEGASFRPEEEAIRCLHTTGRNDLLHIDHFSHRPTGGQRILRMFINLNPTEPRVWSTSETFEELLERFRRKQSMSRKTITAWGETPGPLERLLSGDLTPKPAYDRFMARLRDFMRIDDSFQDRAVRKLWHFPPGSMWLLFADARSHAVLRGQFALEHSWFVPVAALKQPEKAPISLLVEAGSEVLRRAA